MQSKMQALVLFVSVVAAVANPQYESANTGTDYQETLPAQPTQYHPVFCDQGSDCVPSYTCVDGHIDTTGYTGGLDLRKGVKNKYVPIECSLDNHVCCLIPSDYGTDGGQGPDVYTGPGGTDSTDHIYPHCSAGLLCVANETCNLYTGFIGPMIPLSPGQAYIQYSHCTRDNYEVGVCCQEVAITTDYGPGGQDGGDYCSPYEDCVPSDLCYKGKIITDGSGLIDVRKKADYRICVNQDYNEPGICCRIPDAPPVVSICPNYGLCTDYSYCDANGYIATDIASSPYGHGTDCFTNPALTYNVGVCCLITPTVTEPPPITYTSCPQNSECIPEDFCFGDLLDNFNTFSPYVPDVSWSECKLGDGIGVGICCRNPLPEVPNTCGVSHYANQGDNLKTRFYAQHLDKKEADFGELPWQAIIFYSNYTFKCGASLISDRHLLTVGHCVKNLYPQDIRIRLGEWQVNTFSEPLPYQDVYVTAITLHPDYKAGPESNNIAILELTEPVNLQYNINNICLPFGGIDFPDYTRCIVSGWGKDSFTGSYQHILKKISIPLVNHHDCQSKLRNTRLGKYFRLHDSYRCAGGEEGIDVCVGDGGGPLACYDEVSKSYIQIGITAWGIGCGQKDVPGAYTDVTKFIPWISSITQLGGGSGNYGK